MPRRNYLFATAWLILPLTLAGCGRPAAVEEKAEQSAPPSPQSDARSDLSNNQAEEVWEAYYLGGAKVGYSHIRSEAISQGGRELVRIKAASQITVQRLNQTVSQKISLESLETPAGSLVSFTTSLADGSGATQSVTKGHAAGDLLSIETTTLGKTTATTIPWDPTLGGLFADRQSLRRKPMKPGERRAIRALVPIVHQPASIQLVAEGIEPTRLLTEERQLLRIRSSTQFAGMSIESTLWTDEAGETLKSSTNVSGVEQVNYQTTKEVALAAGEPATFDLGVQSLVRVDRPLASPHGTSQIVYEIHLSDGDPSQIFVADGSQRVRRLDENSAEITVVAMRPDTPLESPVDDRPTAADLSANNLIQCNDPTIVNMAKKAVGGDNNSWSVAYMLEGYVHEIVTTKGFSQALASAAEVARSREGDCTEHAVLLAALCRAREIPARVAIGLVYYGAAQGFAYHMWNEVWIKDRWVALDATLGQGGIGAAHLKVRTANLAGATPYSALLPVLDVLGKLELKIISVQ